MDRNVRIFCPKNILSPFTLDLRTFYLYFLFMRNNLSDIMSLPRHKQYRFDTERVKRIVDAYGGLQKLSCDLSYSEKQVRRALQNERNVRKHLLRDILATLRVSPLDVGRVVDVA